MSDNNNPYAAAIGAYGQAATIEGGRDLEGKILLKAATRLEGLKIRLESGEQVPIAESGEILEYNQKLWQFFVDAMRNEEHPLPLDIKNNIASLGLFMFKRTLEVMIDTKPEKLQAMIEINRNIAAGLLQKPKEAKPPAPNTGAGAGAYKAAGKHAEKPADKNAGPPPDVKKTDSVV